jgi:hypothetical protein
VPGKDIGLRSIILGTICNDVRLIERPGIEEFLSMIELWGNFFKREMREVHQL